METKMKLERSGISFGTTLGGFIDSVNFDEALGVLAECGREGIFDLERIDPLYVAKHYEGVEDGSWPQVKSVKDVKGIVRAVLYGSIPGLDRGIPERDHRDGLPWKEYVLMGKPKRIIKEVRYRPAREK